MTELTKNEVNLKVGDKVVFEKFADTVLYRVIGWRITDDLICIECLKGFTRKVYEDHLRHATLDEIRAGHRIDANTDYVSDIKNHISPLTIIGDNEQ